MKTATLTIFTLMSMTLASCKFSCSVGSTGDQAKETKTKNGTALYNGIELKANGLHITKAFLTKDGEEVPADNRITLDGVVKLQIEIDSGWVEREGRVMPGASEKIIDDKGNVLLDESDLFQAYDSTGVSSKDARYIALTAEINGAQRTSLSSYDVYFRLWDKNGKGTAEGRYRVFAK